MFDCNNYIISSNGENSHGLPNKSLIAKIIYVKGDNQNFFFNYKPNAYPCFFDENGNDERDIYKFNTFFNEKDNTSLEII